MTTTTDFDHATFRALARQLAGFAPGYAALDLTAEHAADWANRGFTPTEAAPWITADFTPAEAGYWADQFIGPAEALARNTTPAARFFYLIGTYQQVDIDGTPTRVEVCAVDTHRGFRVTDRRWGGRVDTWVPFTAIPTTREGE